MKRHLLFFITIALSLYAYSDDTIPQEELTAREQLKIFRVMEQNVQITQDEAIDQLLLDRIQGTEHEELIIQGFRVQIYSSNKQQTAKIEAYDIERIVQEADLNVESYVIYNPPFWKVRLGDFRTHEEAKQFQEELNKRLPQFTDDTYIVKDQIQVIQ